MSATTLRFATFLAPNVLPVYRLVADGVARRLGCGTELVIGSSFVQLETGEVDVAFICGLPYVRLARRDPPPVELLAAPVLQGERYAGKPVYFSDVIVRRESPFRSFSDLRGRSWSYNDPDSHSGYNVTRFHMVQMGETGGFFGEVVEAGRHQRSIALVAEGKVDASAIDSQVLAIEMRDRPDLAARLRVIDSLGPSTIQPVVAASRLSGALKAELRSVLLELGDDPATREALDRGFVERFVRVDDSAYDDIRMMLAAAESAGYLTLR